MNALQNEPQRGQPGKTQIQIEALPPLLIASVDDDWPIIILNLDRAARREWTAGGQRHRQRGYGEVLFFPTSMFGRYASPRSCAVLMQDRG